MSSIKEKYEIEDRHNLVINILKDNGFAQIVRMPRLCLYDFEAVKDGERCYVEVRSRSAKYSPWFVFKRSKLERLKELKKESGREVYVLLIHGSSYRLFELSDFPCDLKPFKVRIHGTDIKAWRFPARGELTDEEKAKIIELRRKGYTENDIAVTMGVTESTVRRWLPRELRGRLPPELRSRVIRPKTKVGKRKTVISIDKQLWKTFSILVIQERGLRKNNEVIEELIRDYCKGKRISKSSTLSS